MSNGHSPAVNVIKDPLGGGGRRGGKSDVFFNPGNDVVLEGTFD